MNTAALPLLATLLLAPLSARAQTPAPKKVDIVSITGCLREQGPNLWMVVAATDAVPSTANAPTRAEIPAAPPDGKNRYQLIGVGEFDLPTFRNQTVVVKGLHIKAAPVDRLNITSIVTATTSCVESAPK